MSDYKIPELPSDEELGIDDEDLKEIAGDAEREMSPAEMLALLGDEQAPPPQPPKGDKAKAPPKEVPDAPRGWAKGPLTLLVLLGVAWLSRAGGALPDPVPANAPDTSFSSARAMASLVEVARAPHPTGSPEHARIRGILVSRLADLGLEPEVETTTVIVGAGSARRGATVRNVVARIPGSDPTGAVLVTAHYDGAGVSTAAADDGSGVVAILEAVRALRAGRQLRNDVIVLFTDAEELGLMGARAFVESSPAMQDVSFVVALEMRGGGGPVYMFETASDDGWAIRALQRGDPAPFANSIAVEVYRRMPNDTDFSIFRSAGVQGLNFAAIGRPGVYHQAYDTPDRLSEATLQHEGVHTLGMLRELGGADLATVDAPDVVYFSVPFVGLLVFDPIWVLGLGAALVLALAGLFVVVRLRRGRLVAIGAAVGVPLLAGALAYGAGRWLVGWAGGSVVGQPVHVSGWYLVALVGAAFTLVTVLNGVARRWLTSSEALLGGALIPAGLAIAATFAVPMGAMDLQWPALGGLCGALVLAAGLDRRVRWLGWALAMLLAVPALALLVPLVQGLWLALGFGVGAVLGAFVVLALYTMLPALDALREPNGVWAPAVGAVVTGVAVWLGAAAPAYSAEHPLPSTLVYAFDHETGRALWVTDEVDQPGDSVARVWVESATGASFTHAQSMAPYLPYDEPVPVADADVGPVPEPEIVTLADSTGEGVRRVELGVRSQVGAELVQFVFPEGGATRPVSLNAIQLADPRPTVLQHWGAPDTMIVLGLEVRGGGEPAFELYEHLLRPQELVGPTAFERPDYIAPDPWRMSNRAILRSAYGITSSGAAGEPGAPGAAADSAAARPGGGGS